MDKSESISGWLCLRISIPEIYIKNEPLTPLRRAPAHIPDSAGTSRGAYQVLKNHIPTNNECNEFAHSHIAVHISRPRRMRDTHTELSITNT